MVARRKNLFDNIEFRIIKIAILVLALIVVLKLILLEFIDAIKLILPEFKALFF
jgi:hypothetical protein